MSVPLQCKVSLFWKSIHHCLTYSGIWFSLASIFLCKDRIVDFVFILDYKGQRKPVFSACCLIFMKIRAEDFLNPNSIIAIEEIVLPLVRVKNTAPSKRQTIWNIIEIKHKLKHKIFETSMDIHNTVRRPTRHTP